jgi:hypothetical protein
MAYRFGRLFETEGKRRSNRGPKAAELSGNLRCRAPALSTSVVSAPASKQSPSWLVGMVPVAYKRRGAQMHLL